VGLQARLEFPLPRSLRSSRADAIFCFGTCFHPTAEIQALELVAGGERHSVDVWGMPRPDVHSAQPDAPSFRSGFWSTVTVGAQPAGELGWRTARSRRPSSAGSRSTSPSRSARRPAWSRSR
jgi:hypothetical protein